MPVKELCRQHGFSEASCYLWRGKFGGMSVSEKAGSPQSPFPVCNKLSCRFRNQHVNGPRAQKLLWVIELAKIRNPYKMPRALFRSVKNHRNG
jgi:hypothetical protein